MNKAPPLLHCSGEEYTHFELVCSFESLMDHESHRIVQQRTSTFMRIYMYLYNICNVLYCSHIMCQNEIEKDKEGVTPPPTPLSTIPNPPTYKVPGSVPNPLNIRLFQFKNMCSSSLNYSVKCTKPTDLSQQRRGEGCTTTNYIHITASLDHSRV